MAQGEEEGANQLLGMFSFPKSFPEVLASEFGQEVDPGSFIRGFFQQDTKALTPLAQSSDQPPKIIETSLDDDESLEETKDFKGTPPITPQLVPVKQRISDSSTASDTKQSRPSIEQYNSDGSVEEVVDKFSMAPPETILKGGVSLREELSSDESAKLRVVASRSNSVRGGPQVRLGGYSNPTSFSPSGSDSEGEILLSETKGKGRGPPKPLTLGMPARASMSVGGGGGGGVGGKGGLAVGGSMNKGGGLAARRGLMLNRTISDPVKIPGKSPTLRERMRGGPGQGGGGGGLVIDTKSAHENRFSSAWEGVRLKAPSAVRLRQTKARSGEDSPTVLKLLNATKLCIKGLLLDLEQRRFAALARELIRRGYAPPEGVIDYADANTGSDKNKRQRSSLTHKRQRATLLQLRRRRSTATTLPNQSSTDSFSLKEGSAYAPPARRSLMGSMLKSFSTSKELKQSNSAAGSDILCTAPLLKWMTEVYAGEELNLAAKDLVQSVVHVTSSADREKIKAGMVVVLSEFEARLRCGLLNLNALVDTLVMLNLLPVTAAEAPLHSKFTTTLALLRQWCVGSLAVSHIALREVQRSQLQSLSPLQDASGDSESEEERDFMMENSFIKRHHRQSSRDDDGEDDNLRSGKTNASEQLLPSNNEDAENDKQIKERAKWGEIDTNHRPSVTFRSLSASSGSGLWDSVSASSSPTSQLDQTGSIGKVPSLSEEEKPLSMDGTSSSVNSGLNRSSPTMRNMPNRPASTVRSGSDMLLSLVGISDKVTEEVNLDHDSMVDSGEGITSSGMNRSSPNSRTSGGMPNRPASTVRSGSDMLLSLVGISDKVVQELDLDDESEADTQSVLQSPWRSSSTLSPNIRSSGMPNRPASTVRSGSDMLLSLVGISDKVVQELDLDDERENGTNEGDTEITASLDSVKSLVDKAGNPKGMPLDTTHGQIMILKEAEKESNASEQNLQEKDVSTFDNFFSAAASFTAAAVSVARQAVGTKDIIDRLTNDSSTNNEKNGLAVKESKSFPKINIEVSPRRVRSLYEYIARYRARGTEEVSKHLQLRMQGRASALQNRLGLRSNSRGGLNHRRVGGSSSGSARSPSSHGMTGPLKLEPVQHVWSIGDIHAEFKENMAWITELPSHGNDALIVTGNVAASLTVLHRALAKLRRRFKYVFYVFGNQDLWTANFDGDSVEKFFAILDLCDSLGVVTTPAFLGDDLAIVPLFSWYNVRSPAPANHNHFASGSRPRVSVSGGSRQRTGSWGDNRRRNSSDDNDDMSGSNHSGMMGGGSSSYRYSIGGAEERRRSSNNMDPDRRRSSMDGRSISPRSGTAARFWHRSSMNSGEASTPRTPIPPHLLTGGGGSGGGSGGGGGGPSSPTSPNLNEKGGIIDFPVLATSTTMVPEIIKDHSRSSDSDLTKDTNVSTHAGDQNWGTAMTNQTSFGNRQLWFQLQRFRNVDAQCKWPLAIETAVPASAYRPPEYEGGGKSNQERGLFSAAAAAAVVSGASAFFHELNREAMGFDYGTRRVISASHFVPHDRLTTINNKVNDNDSNVLGSWPRPPPLTEEIERLNSTAHVFSGGGGEALSRVVALEGTCYMQHTIGYFDHKKYSDSILPRRGDKKGMGPDSGGGGLRSSLPSYAAEEGDLPTGLNLTGSMRERLNSATSASSGGGGSVRERSESAASAGNGSFKLSQGGRDRSGSAASASNGSFKLSQGGRDRSESSASANNKLLQGGRERSASAASASNKLASAASLSLESDRAIDDKETSPPDSYYRKPRQEVVAAIRRLQLTWDDNHYSELTTIAALEAVAVLKRGVPIVKHGRNRVAGGRTMYVVVTYHNSDGSAATSIPSDKENKDNPLTTYGSSNYKKNGHRSGGLRGFGGRPTSGGGNESDEESDGSTLSISSTSTNVKTDGEGFTKVWLELGARRGSISSSTTLGSSGPKRLDLAHLRGVCVGRQTDTFKKSRRQPPPPPANQTVGAVGQGEPGPGSPELCLSLIGGEGWAHRSVDLEFKSIVARDSCLRFFRYEMRRLEQKRGMGLLPPAAAAAAAAARASAIAAAASVASASRRRRSTFL